MAFIDIPKTINPRNYQNPANTIAAEAKKKGKSYWAIAQKYGHQVRFLANKAWMRHLIYQSKLEARRKHAEI